MSKQFITAIALAFTTLSTSAAGPAGFYIGADVGTTKIDNFGDDSGYGVFGGYKFDQIFAMELGYRDLGTFRFYGANVDTKQTSLSMLVAAPLGKGFSIYGRLGYNNIAVDVRGSNGNDIGSLAGVGFGYAFNENVSARIEYQRPASDMQNASFGLSYKF